MVRSDSPPLSLLCVWLTRRRSVDAATADGLSSFLGRSEAVYTSRCAHMPFLHSGASTCQQVTPLQLQPDSRCGCWSLATKSGSSDTVLGNADPWLVTLKRNWDSGDARVAVPSKFLKGQEKVSMSQQPCGQALLDLRPFSIIINTLQPNSSSPTNSTLCRK